MVPQSILTVHGLEELFFQLCRCVSFLVAAGLTYVLFGVTPNFLLTCGNRYSEGTDDRQMILCGYPNFDSYVKYLRIWYSGQTDGQRYR